MQKGLGKKFGLVWVAAGFIAGFCSVLGCGFLLTQQLYTACAILLLSRRADSYSPTP
jgi:hypothetical protein